MKTNPNTYQLCFSHIHSDPTPSQSDLHPRREGEASLERKSKFKSPTQCNAKQSKAKYLKNSPRFDFIENRDI